jgi:outer membrane protein OmpA-like peptidoglycan-associated protein
MNDTSVHASPEWGTFRRWYFWIAGLLALLLALSWLMGYGPGGKACALPTPVVAAAPVVVAPPPPPAPVVEVAPPPVVAAPVVAAPVVAAAPVVVPPAARVYFGLDKTGLPGDVDKTLAEVVSFLKANAGAKASIAGFHDPSGDMAHNLDLAKNRAVNVRNQLQSFGIEADRIVMQKPAQTTGTGAPREARRVEVGVMMP